MVNFLFNFTIKSLKSVAVAPRAIGSKAKAIALNHGDPRNETVGLLEIKRLLQWNGKNINQILQRNISSTLFHQI